MIYTACLWLQGKRPVPLRSKEKVFTKDSLSQNDQENLMKCLKIRRSVLMKLKRENIDFNIPGLRHSTVKQLHGADVRELIHKIENNEHRQALQRDLEQSQQFNPFSEESKKLIHEVGNIELCELLDVEPKPQCKVCLLGHWHRLLHVRALLAKWE